MAKTHPIATAILMVLLATPLVAPLCAAGLCDVNVGCEIPMQSTSADNGLKLVGPSCCLSMSASIAEPQVATQEGPWNAGLAALMPLAISSIPAPPPPRPTAQASTPVRSGRTTLTLHRTLLL